MAELSYPSAGGGSVTDANYENLIGSFAPSGLVGSVTTSVPMVFADSTGRQVKVRPGRAAMVRGFRWETDGAGIIRAIDANTSGQPRIDLAVLRLNRADWTVTFQIIKGTPAATPVPPALTQQPGPTGVWELPLANITVANGSSTLTGTAVLDRGVYISSQVYSGNRSAPPVPALNPLLFYASDVDRTYAYMSGNYQIIGEAGALVKSPAVAAWGGSGANLYFRRWNGFVYMQGILPRVGADLAPDSESGLAIIPGVYRPMHDIAIVGYAGGNAIQLYVDGSSGAITLQNYTFGFKKGASLYIHPVLWAANNIV